jgi:hypothetical protein
MLKARPGTSPTLLSPQFDVPMYFLLPLLTQINSDTEIRLSVAQAWGFICFIVLGIPSLIAIVRQYERTRIRFDAQEGKIEQLTALSEKQEQKIVVLTKQVETLSNLVRDVLKGQTRKRRTTSKSVEE